MCNEFCEHVRNAIHQLRHPLFLERNCDFEDYFKRCDVDARTCYRKATRLGYQTEHLSLLTEKDHADLGRIWYSKDIRQKRPINPKYYHINQEKFDIFLNKWPINDYSDGACCNHGLECFVVKREETIFGYLELIKSYDYYIVHSTMGHASHLKDGIMKFLFLEVIKSKPDMKILMYGEADALAPAFTFKKDLLIYEAGREDELRNEWNK